MSDVADEELLNGEEEFDYSSYDLGYEEEEALLEDKDYGSGDDDFKRKKALSEKKESSSDIDEPEEDILNLGIEGEEDFQDVEDKITYEEEQPHEKKKDGKFTVERTQVPSTSTSSTTTPLQVTKRPVNSTNSTATVIQTKFQTARKVQPRVIDNKRKRGIGRGNFQSRTAFVRNNVQKDRRPGRRNGTVFINPKYEGVVQVPENNARLAWDNSNYSQNNASFIQPWASSKLNQRDRTVLLNNLVEFAATFSQSSNMLPFTPSQPPPSQPPAPTLNFEPPPNVYQQQVGFQPVPNMQTAPPPVPPQSPYPNPSQQWNDSYNGLNETQVLNHQTSFQHYHSSGPQQFNTQPLPNNYNNYYQSDSNNHLSSYPVEGKRNYPQTTYENRSMNFYNNNVKNQMKSGFQNQQNDFDFRNRNTFRNNHYSQQNAYSGGNIGYNMKDTYQNRNFTYTQDPKIGQNPNNQDTRMRENRNLGNRQENYNKNGMQINYENRNMNQRDVENSRITFKNNSRDFNVNTNNKNVQNRPLRQISTRNEMNRQNTVEENINIVVQKNRRFLNENEELRTAEFPEKKLKVEDQLNQTSAENTAEKVVYQKKEQAVSTTTTFMLDEEEDEEMRLYRLKIEEQKREREKVLKMKEERRKLMLQQQQREDENSAPTSGTVSSQQQFAVATDNQKNYQQQHAASKTIQKVPSNQKVVINQQQTAAPVNIQKINYQHRFNNPNLTFTAQTKAHQKTDNNLQSGTEDELSNLTFKISNNLQRNVLPSEKVQQKKDSSSSSFMSNRVVIVKNKNDNNEKVGVLSNPNIVKTVSNDSEPTEVGQGLSSFFNNRKVLKKDNMLVATRLVVINNLSASTDQNKLVAMTRGIGDIQKLRMDKQERQATILFKTVASAHLFFKKYQRYMLDLSMIEVRLEPMI